jgi:hypothetical protein
MLFKVLACCGEVLFFSSFYPGVKDGSQFQRKLDDTLFIQTEVNSYYDGYTYFLIIQNLKTITRFLRSGVDYLEKRWFRNLVVVVQ